MARSRTWSAANRREIPDYRSVPGNLSAHVLERREGDVTHFVTLTFWESLDAIRAFAGDDLEKARHYAEDADILLEYEPPCEACSCGRC